jgi:hypothetical protein
MGYKHGESHTHLYAVWKSMRQRCQNSNHRAYLRYGGRGISVCDEWQDYEKFKEWALSSGYDESAGGYKCSLDRVDNNGGYNPSNCRWVDYKIQANNRRNYKVANSMAVEQIDENGEVIKRFTSMTQAEKATGVDHHFIKNVCSGKWKQTKGTRWRYAVC